jgi:hypothetical protein
MATEVIDYRAVLADLEAKRTAIDSTINGLRQMLNLGAEQTMGGASASNGERRDQATQVRFDSFFRMSLPAAITKFLEMATVPQSVSEITRAILEGGFKTTSKNLMPIVGSNLSRMKTAGEVVNVDGKWGLSIWYPAARQQQAATKPKGRKRGRPKSAESPKSTTTPETPDEAPKRKLTRQQIEIIKELHDDGKSNGDIAKELGISNIEVWRVLRPPKNPAATV